MEVWPGQPYPLGASFDGTGTNFSLFTEVAERVELCLFDDEGHETRLDLPEKTALCWHGYLPNIRPGQLYGYRVYGPYEPALGMRANPSKLVLDPYAKAIAGDIDWNESIFAYQLGDDDLVKDASDSGRYMPKSVVIDPWFMWEDDRRLRTPWHETVIYEVHVKGFTCRHPEIEPKTRGTYAGLCSPEAIAHFNRLG